MAPPIAKIELEQAITKGETSVRELIMGTKEKPYQEQEKKERTTQALAILQNELQGMKSSEKMVIIKVARELTEELKMEVERNVAVAEELKAGGVVDNMTTHGREIVKEMKEGDWWTRGKYIGAAVAGGMALKWLWDHTAGWVWDKTVGDPEHPGIFRRIMNGIVMAGGAVLGAVGLSHFSRSDSKLAKTVRNVGAAGKGALDTTKEVLEPEMDAFMKLWKELFGKENIDWMEVLKKGGGLLVSPLESFLILGEKTIKIPKQLFDSLVNFGITSEQFWAAYGSAGALYVMDKSIMNTILHGKPGLMTNGVKGSIGRTIVRGALWPAYVVRDAAGGIYLTMFKGGREILSHKIGTFPRLGWISRSYRAGLSAAKIPNAASLALAGEHFLTLHDACSFMRRNPEGLATFHKIGFDKHQILDLENQFKEVAKEFRSSILATDLPKDAPKWLHELKDQARNGVGDKFAEFMSEKVPFETAHGAPKTPDASKKGPAAGEKTDPKGKGTPGEKAEAKGKGTPAEGSKPAPKEAPKTPKGPARPAEQILKEAKDAKSLRGAQLTETLKELQRTGKFPALTDDVIHAVSNGGAKAEKIAAGYLKTGDATDIVKLGKSFGKAARTSIPSGLLGIGGDAFGVWVAYNDLQENYKNIEEARKTGNTELRHLYETATVVNKVEIGLYTASAGLQFAGFFWATAAGASVVAIPVTLVVGLGAMGYKEIHGNLERWLRNAKDWMKFPPETLMKCLMEQSDETLMQQIASLGNQAQYNNSTRWLICKAYIALTSKVSKHPDEDADGEEGDRRFRKREAEYLEDQLGYIGWATNRTYKFADPFIFEQARTHARLTAAGRQARELKEKGFTAPLTMKIKGKDGKDHEVDLAEYGAIESDPSKPDYQEKSAHKMQIAADTTETQEGELLTELAALAKQPAEFARHAPAMIVGMMRDSIAFIEGKILKWDDTFSGSARRWWNDDVAASRGFIADQLKNGINAIIAAVVQGKEVTVSAMAKHIEGLRTLLRDTDPNSKIPPQMEGNRAYYISVGRDAQLLTPQGITKLINDYPVIAPREASESPDQPTSIVALIAHATPVNTHSHVREIKIKANKQGVVNVNGLQGWHYDAVNADGSLHMFKNSLDNQHAVPKGRFLFWQPVHTPHVNKAELMLIVE